MNTHKTNRAAMRNAVTGVLSFVLLAGCTMGDKPVASNVSSAEAKQMLANGQSNAAVDAAESAVLSSPRDAGYRAGLGNAYLKAGRFEAAATSFEDARSLGDKSPRTALSLALAKIGAGQNAEALRVLAANRSDIPASDLGLAVSLAGDPRGGISILSEAIRNGENTAKVRQNLAYSYALAGQWREARVMAAEDVPADQVSDRIAKWAETARPDLARNRVAALIDAPVVVDPGQPQQLALRNSPDAVQLAQVEPKPAAPQVAAVAQPVRSEAAPVSRPVAPVTVARAVPAPQPVAAKAPVKPRDRYVSNPVVQVTAARSVAAPRADVSRTAPAPKAAAPAVALNATHIVQLGSFSSKARAEKAWDIYLKRNPSLKEYERVITPAVVRGKTYYRVQAAGFDRSGARQMCGVVAKNGEGCLAYADPRGPQQGVGGAMRARR